MIFKSQHIAYCFKAVKLTLGFFIIFDYFSSKNNNIGYKSKICSLLRSKMNCAKQNQKININNYLNSSHLNMIYLFQYHLSENQKLPVYLRTFPFFFFCIFFHAFFLLENVCVCLFIRFFLLLGMIADSYRVSTFLNVRFLNYKFVLCRMVGPHKSQNSSSLLVSLWFS